MIIFSLLIPVIDIEIGETEVSFSVQTFIGVIAQLLNVVILDFAEIRYSV